MSYRKTGSEYSIEVKTKWYIGDPCYALKEEVYDDWGRKSDYDDCSFKDENTGLSFAVQSTAYGDGCYESNSPKGWSFPVDAGCICIAPIELCDPEKVATLNERGKDFGYIVEGQGEATIEYDDGKIIINGPNVNDLVIYTGDDDFDVESDEEYDE